MGKEVMKEGEVKAIVIREGVILLVSLATVLLTATVIRNSHTYKLRTLLVVKRVAQKQADAWQGIANNAATTYHKAHM
jgi:hypothetical protein